MVSSSRRSGRARLGGVLVAALIALGAGGHDRRLTVDDIYDPETKLDFDGEAPSSLAWIDDAHYHWAKAERKGGRTEHLKVEAVTGRFRPLFDPARMKQALERIEGVGASEAERLSALPAYPMTSSGTAAILDVKGDLYHYTFGGGEAVRLTSAAGAEEEPTYSPDGRRVAFVRGNDLHVVEVRTRKERRLTRDGSADILNGKLDWLYQEEVYGRGRYRGYWWSPDSSRLAFLQLDEKEVPRYSLLDDAPYRPSTQTWPYPKPGESNPKARLGVVQATGGSTTWVDLDGYTGTDILVVDVGWTPDSRQVAYQVQDREQTWLDLNVADPSRGRSRTLLRETSRAWVERLGSPYWLKDGSFLILSDRTAWRHVHHHRPDGSPVRAVTAGKWQVQSLHGVDPASGTLYFSATERSHVGSDVYAVSLDGTGLRRLSRAPGTHTAAFNPSRRLYLDTWSDATTPKQVRLHRADGSEARVVDARPARALKGLRLSRPEFVQVETRDGFVMEAVLLKPPDFDPARRYPVFQHTYGGPHAPQVKDAWGGKTHMFHQMLAQRGIVVWILDNRTSSGKGMDSAWTGHRRLGEVELRDIEDGVEWLKRQPWVDAKRIGIEGWSYGGFVVAYALTHSKSFAMGIAGAPVTDWRDYDTIYTERHMGTPRNNPEGYRRSSPRAAAAKLHGRLLLMHGTIDDNVHPQNTLQFAHELQKAGKPFRMMMYPHTRHGLSDPALERHLRSTMAAFIEETLLAR